MTAAVVVSFMTNLLALVQPVFMLHVYDYVLSSQSRSTLFWLLVIALFLILVLSALDFLRGRLMAEVALETDRQVREKAFLGSYARALAQRQFGRSSFSGDLDTVRAFLTGPGATALMDLPWTPIFIVVLFMLSPILGIISIAFSVAGGAGGACQPGRRPPAGAPGDRPEHARPAHGRGHLPGRRRGGIHGLRQERAEPLGGDLAPGRRDQQHRRRRRAG